MSYATLRNNAAHDDKCHGNMDDAFDRHYCVRGILRSRSIKICGKYASFAGSLVCRLSLTVRPSRGAIMETQHD